MNRNTMTALLLTAAVVITGAFSGCASKVKQCPPPDRPDVTHKDLPEFEQEGFIDDSTYRLIIIEPLGAGEPRSRKDLEDSARSRAISSLQKYLYAENKQVDAGTRTGLLNLVDRHGALRLVEKNNATRRVYYFEIRKEGLRRYLSDLCDRR